MFSDDSGQKEKPVFDAKEVSLEDYLDEINNIPILTREQERDLAKKIRKGDEQALRELIKANLRYVVSIAKQYVNQGLSLADLVNKGNLGMIKAAYRFDEKRGYKFISYAVWYIRQAMLQALANQSRIVRLPLNRFSNVYQIGKAARAADQESGCNPAPEVNALNHKASSERNEVVDHQAGEEFTSIDEPKTAEVLSDDMRKALDTLTDRERTILTLYFGCEGQEALSLEEISKIVNLMPERVRQIKEKAILRLRHNSRSKYLKGYFEN
jgi:RNA polymerase primary sigma factor